MSTGHTGAEQDDAPTDLELMLYADGELTGERLAKVQAYIGRSVAARRKLAALGLVSGIVSEHARRTGDAAEGIADAVMARIEGRTEARPVPEQLRRRKRAANDNARSLLAFVVFAAAAAAALLIWGRSAGDRQLAVRVPTSADDPAPIAHRDREGDSDVGVEVAAVDFGTRTGAIFYVPTEAAASSATTTVVWLSDDDADGDE